MGFFDLQTAVDWLVRVLTVVVQYLGYLLADGQLLFYIINLIAGVGFEGSHL